MKFKIYDFLQEKYYPGSKDIFIPSKEGVSRILDSLVFDGKANRLSVFIYIYSDKAIDEKSPMTFCTLEEFDSFYEATDSGIKVK